jgi:DNA-binding LacI/PurR family transcriptional regulator
MNVGRVAKMVKQMETDAWLVCAASGDVLNWFSDQKTPTFAVFGRFSLSKIAGTGPDKIPAYKAAIRRLVELGHRRIVLLLPQQMKKPEIGQLPQQILCEMESHGIKISSYNLPDWESSPTGLRRCLDLLFRFTPPTALFIEEPFEFFAVRDHLAKKGIFAPRDVSLICSDYHPVFEWCDPSVSCIHWSVDPLVKRVIRWVENSKRGKEDRERSFFRANFIEGATMAAAPRGR